MAIEITDEAIALLLERLLVPERGTAPVAPAPAPAPGAGVVPPKRPLTIGTALGVLLSGMSVAGGLAFILFLFGFLVPAWLVPLVEQPAAQATTWPAAVDTPTSRPPASMPQQPISVPPAPVMQQPTPQPTTPPQPTPSGLGGELTMNSNGASLSLQVGNPHAPAPTAPLPTIDVSQPAELGMLANRVDQANGGEPLAATPYTPGAVLPTVQIRPVDPSGGDDETMTRACANSGAGAGCVNGPAVLDAQTMDAIACAADLAAGGAGCPTPVAGGRGP